MRISLAGIWFAVVSFRSSCVPVLRSCRARAALAQRSCSAHAAILLRSCSVRAALMQHSCSARAAFMQRSCRVHAALVPRSCSARAALVQRSCSAPAALLQRSCGGHARPAWCSVHAARHLSSVPAANHARDAARLNARVAAFTKGLGRSSGALARRPVCSVWQGRRPASFLRAALAWCSRAPLPPSVVALLLRGRSTMVSARALGKYVCWTEPEP